MASCKNDLFCTLQHAFSEAYAPMQLIESDEQEENVVKPF